MGDKSKIDKRRADFMADVARALAEPKREPFKPICFCGEPATHQTGMELYCLKHALEAKF